MESVKRRLAILEALTGDGSRSPIAVFSWGGRYEEGEPPSDPETCTIGGLSRLTLRH